MAIGQPAIGSRASRNRRPRMEDNEFQAPLQRLGQLNLNRIIDQARADRAFMNRLVAVLEESGADDRTDEENDLLEWARTFQRPPGTDAGG